MDSKLLKKIVEGALLASNQPLTVAKIASLFDPREEGELDLSSDSDDKPSKDEIQAALEDIQADCKGRGYELKEVGSGWRFQVIQDTAPWISRLWEEKPQKYSRALLETLALIAYRQPITRGEIESIRGVAVSSHIIKTLTEREWVKVVGHRDVPGRPALYATTKQFLDYFNLRSLDELPSLKEIKEIDKLDSELDFEAAAAEAAANQGADSQAGDNEAIETGEATIEDVANALNPEDSEADDDDAIGESDDADFSLVNDESEQDAGFEDEEALENDMSLEDDIVLEDEKSS